MNSAKEGELDCTCLCRLTRIVGLELLFAVNRIDKIPVQWKLSTDNQEAGKIGTNEIFHIFLAYNVVFFVCSSKKIDLQNKCL